jgi:uncharacterized Zn finger protein
LPGNQIFKNMKLNISNLRKLEEVFLSDRSDSPRIGQYSQLYHISELPVKCPRCSNFGELIEDGPVRSLYRCPDCGIFTKLTPKRQDKDGKPIKCRLKNPCKGCGGSQGIITEVDRSTGNPHSYRLECRECGRFQRWVGQREFDRKMGGRDNA